MKEVVIKMSDEGKEIVRALIRGLKQTIALLEKLLKKGVV